MCLWNSQSTIRCYIALQVSIFLRSHLRWGANESLWEDSFGALPAKKWPSGRPAVFSVVGEKNGLLLCVGTFFGHTSLAASQVATHFDIQFFWLHAGCSVGYRSIEHTRHILIKKFCFMFVYILKVPTYKNLKNMHLSND